MDNSNVIDFADRRRRKEYPLFAPELRTRLEDSVKGFTERPSETITTVEQVVCAHIVSSARCWATKFGESIGHRIADMILGEDRSI